MHRDPLPMSSVVCFEQFVAVESIEDRINSNDGAESFEQSWHGGHES